MKRRPQRLPVPRAQLAEFYSRHPDYVRRHPVELKRNPKTYAASQGLLAKRRAAQAKALDTPEQFVKPLTPSSAGVMADKLAGAQFDPQIRASGAAEGRIDPWFADYKQSLAEIAARSNAAQQQAVGQAQQFQQSAGQVDEAERQRRDQAMRADAATRGAQVDPGLSADASKAAAARSASVGAFGSMLAAQGANQAQYSGNVQGIAGQQQIQKHLDEQRLRRGLVAQRGAEKEKQLGVLKEAERRYGLEQQAFGLNVAKAGATASHQTQQDRIAAARTRSTARSNAANRAIQRQRLQETARHNRAQEQDAARQRALATYKAHHPKTTGGSKGGTGGAKAQEKFNSSFNVAYNRVWAKLDANPKEARIHPAGVLSQALQLGGSSPGGQAGARAAYNRWRRRHGMR